MKKQPVLKPVESIFLTMSCKFIG